MSPSASRAAGARSPAPRPRDAPRDGRRVWFLDPVNGYLLVRLSGVLSDQGNGQYSNSLLVPETNSIDQIISAIAGPHPSAQNKIGDWSIASPLDSGLAISTMDLSPPTGPILAGEGGGWAIVDAGVALTIPDGGTK